ncbi:MAG: glycerophosphodiester phosphodiesterase [Gemmatimonadota bacterium]
MELIAHRGMPRKSRENTLAGFVRAVAAGADAIELDVHATADGVIVVHHDPILPPPSGRPVGSHGPAIATSTFDSLRQDTVYGVDIPTLGETLACIGRRTFTYVEIKAAGIERRVLDVLDGHHASAAVHSFDHRVSLRCRELAPKRPTGILSASYLLEPGRVLQTANARDYWQSWELIDEALVERVHRAGGRILAWTVNSVEDAARLKSMGVDGVCTDVADVIGASLRARGGGAGAPSDS